MLSAHSVDLHDTGSLRTPEPHTYTGHAIFGRSPWHEQFFMSLREPCIKLTSADAELTVSLTLLLSAPCIDVHKPPSGVPDSSHVR